MLYFKLILDGFKEEPMEVVRRCTRLSTSSAKKKVEEIELEEESKNVLVTDIHLKDDTKVENGKIPSVVDKPRKRGRPKKIQHPNIKNLSGRRRERPGKVLISVKHNVEDSILGRLRQRVKIPNCKESEGSNKTFKVKKVKKEKKEKPQGPSVYVQKSKETDENIAKYMKLKCELCPTECTTFAEVRAHYRLTHKRKGYIVCCNKKFYRRILILEHINKHLNPDYFRCELCDKTFSDRQCLRSHMIVMHEPEERKIHRCDQCPRSYSKQYMLERHKLIHVPLEERTFFCKHCGKAFPSNSLLHSHIRSVHENAYGVMCHICAKVIQGKTMLAKHQLEHAGIVEPKVQCKQCGSWLKHKYSLKKHMERHAERYEEQLNPQEYECNICGKISVTKAGLRSHIKYVHLARRIHQCNICEKSFKKPLSLKEHMTTHTGEVLYTCPHCPKTFNSSANMHSHRKKVHREEWEENRRKRELAREFLKNNIDDSFDAPDQLPVEVVIRDDELQLVDNSEEFESKENCACSSNNTDN